MCWCREHCLPDDLIRLHLQPSRRPAALRLSHSPVLRPSVCPSLHSKQFASLSKIVIASALTNTFPYPQLRTFSRLVSFSLSKLNGFVPRSISSLLYLLLIIPHSHLHPSFVMLDSSCAEWPRFYGICSACVRSLHTLSRHQYLVALFESLLGSNSYRQDGNQLTTTLLLLAAQVRPTRL
jgi:hypothetical protein